MSEGSIHCQIDSVSGIARVEIANPGRRNAIKLSMWRELRDIFERLQHLPLSEAPLAVIVHGADGQFASGGDISEFADFRFDEGRLHDFHENILAPALHAMLDCDIPLFAQIEGACIGGGLEVAACCDIRVCGRSSRFGTPLAKLGFPMAPAELEVLYRLIPEPLLRELLLEARLLDAGEALQHGLVYQCVDDAQVASITLQRAQTLVSSVSPQASRINKQTLRLLGRGSINEAQRAAHYRYADSSQHREGIAAFIAKRPPRFQRG